MGSVRPSSGSMCRLTPSSSMRSFRLSRSLPLAEDTPTTLASITSPTMMVSGTDCIYPLSKLDLNMNPSKACHASISTQIPSAATATTFKSRSITPGSGSSAPGRGIEESSSCVSCNLKRSYAGILAKASLKAASLEELWAGSSLKSASSSRDCMLGKPWPKPLRFSARQPEHERARKCLPAWMRLLRLAGLNTAEGQGTSRSLTSAPLGFTLQISISRVSY
mmetsp:Transcript_81246/g.153635  ORF Transcript_81246/g.153635 Transcript_81246/m.153635 type:complete len:222 (+) Transcript_81246:182-847(+)